MDHIFHSQILYVYGQGKAQTTRIAAPNPKTGELEAKDVVWFKTDFSRHVILANEDCDCMLIACRLHADCMLIASLIR